MSKVKTSKLLKKIVSKLGLPADDATINRIQLLLRERQHINNEDIKAGFDDDTLDDINIRLKTKNGTLTKFAKKITTAFESE